MVKEQQFSEGSFFFKKEERIVPLEFKMEPYILFFIQLLAILYYGYFFVCLVMKHKTHYSAVHIFELTTLWDILVWIACYIVRDVIVLLDVNRDSVICSVIKIVEHAAMFCFHIHLASSQLEMFLSVHANVYYHNFMTPRNAVLTVLVLSVMMTLTSVVVSPLLPRSMLCPASVDYCSLFSHDKFYLITIPMLSCLVVVLGVGAYITYLHFHPAPVPNVNLQLGHAGQDIEEIGGQNELTPRLKTVSSRLAWEIKFPKEKIIRRKNENPFMFFRVAPAPSTSPPSPCQTPTGQCLPSGTVMEALKNVKKCLKLNIISLFVIGLMIPESIMLTYVFLNDKSDACYSSNLAFVAEYIVPPLTYVFAIGHPYLVRKKLDNFMS